MRQSRTGSGLFRRNANRRGRVVKGNPIGFEASEAEALDGLQDLIGGLVPA